MKIVRIFCNKSLEQGGDDVERTDTVNEMRIEILHFLTVALVQNLQARAFSDIGFRAMAAREQDERDYAGERTRLACCLTRPRGKLFLLKRHFPFGEAPNGARGGACAPRSGLGPRYSKRIRGIPR